LTLFSFLCGAHADPPKLKKISYRGGVVEFFIPGGWNEEYERDGEGTFSDPSPDSATLRLNLITVKSPVPLKENSAVEALKNLRQAQSSRVESLTNGNACLAYSEPASEVGHKLCMFYWIIANPVKPDHIRIAIFSYTLLEGQQEQKRFKDELSILGSEIRKASFAKKLGSTIAN
jgi:hypothetical protein